MLYEQQKEKNNLEAAGRYLITRLLPTEFPIQVKYLFACYLILHTQCRLLYGPGVHSPFRFFQPSSRAYVEAPGGMEAQDLHHPPETGLETTAVSRRASERGWLSHLVEAA